MTQSTTPAPSASVAVSKENTVNQKTKINLLDLNRKQMRELLSLWAKKPFRADQIMKWIYHYCYDDFDQMTDISTKCCVRS